MLGRWTNRDPIGYVDGGSMYASYFAMYGGTDPYGYSIIIRFEYTYNNCINDAYRSYRRSLARIRSLYDNDVDRTLQYASELQAAYYNQQLWEGVTLTVVTFGVGEVVALGAEAVTMAKVISAQKQLKNAINAANAGRGSLRAITQAGNALARAKAIQNTAISIWQLTANMGIAVYDTMGRINNGEPALGGIVKAGVGSGLSPTAQYILDASQAAIDGINSVYGRTFVTNLDEIERSLNLAAVTFARRWSFIRKKLLDDIAKCKDICKYGEWK